MSQKPFSLVSLENYALCYLGPFMTLKPDPKTEEIKALVQIRSVCQRFVLLSDYAIK